MENANADQHSSSDSYSQDPSERHCWICFGTDEDDHGITRDWVSPCKCRGSTRWVHQDCIQRWVDEKLKENSGVKVHCPQCYTEYIISFEEVNNFVRFLNKLDHAISKLCPFLAAGVVVSTIYWTGASYGAVTMMQVMGKDEAITMMENTDPCMLLFLLPSIPVSLIIGKTINWEETLLLVVQKFFSLLPMLRTITPSFLSEPIISSPSPVQLYSVNNPMTTLCTAIIFPTTATVVGNLLFNNSSYSCLQKTLLGGLVYIAVKGVFRIYQSQHNIIKEKTRKVVDYPKTTITEEHN